MLPSLIEDIECQSHALLSVGLLSVGRAQILHIYDQFTRLKYPVSLHFFFYLMLIRASQHFRFNECWPLMIDGRPSAQT